MKQKLIHIFNKNVLKYKVIVMVSTIGILSSNIISIQSVNAEALSQTQLIATIEYKIEENDEYILNLVDCQKQIEETKEQEEQKIEEIIDVNENNEYIIDVIRKVADEQELPAEYLLAVAMIETGGTLNPNTVGPKTKYGSAEGIMQIMPSTQRALGIVDPFDPYQSLTGGATYLKNIMNRFSDKEIKDNDGNIMKLEYIAIIGYNAGPPKIQAHLDAYGYIDIPSLPKETQKYLNKLEEYY